MSVIKRKNTRGEVVWCVRVKKNGAEIFKTFGPGPHNKASAQSFHAEVISLRGSSSLGVNPNLSLDRMLESIKPTYEKRVRASSWATYRPRLDAIRERFGHLPVNRLDRSFAMDIQEWLGEEDRAAKTVNEYIHILSKALSLAIEKGLMASNPLAGYKKLKEPDPRETWHALDDSQIAFIMDRLPDNWFGHYILALLFTGCRAGEIRHMVWRCVDFDRGTLRVEPSEGYRGKTSSARRIVPMLEPIGSILRRNKEAGTVVPFPGANPAKIMPKTTPENNWRAFQSRLKITRIDGRHYRLHDLRHTYACRLARAGVNPAAAQRLLGHSDIRHTMIYYRLTDDEILAEGRKIVLAP